MNRIKNTESNRIGNLQSNQIEKRNSDQVKHGELNPVGNDESNQVGNVDQCRTSDVDDEWRITDSSLHVGRVLTAIVALAELWEGRSSVDTDRVRSGFHLTGLSRGSLVGVDFTGRLVSEGVWDVWSCK